jgi:membrane associated rhomboid family serine protease
MQVNTAQRKRTSLLESVVNCAIGIGIAFGMQVLLFPLFGIHISYGTSGAIAIVFTAISILRSYLLRRLFEYLRVSGLMT